MKAQKKPVVVDFFDYTGDNTEVIKWMESMSQNFYSIFILESNGDLKVKTLEGTSYIVTPLDMIIRGQFSDYYPCKKDIFYNTYNVLQDERDRNR